MKRFLDIHSYRLGRRIGDKLLYISDKEGRPKLYQMMDGVETLLLDVDRVIGYTLDPGRRLVVVNHDEAGNERWRITVLDNVGQRLAEIGDGRSINHIGTPGETYEIPYTSNKEWGSEFGLYIYRLEDGEEEFIYGPETGLYGSGMSRDGELLYAQVFRSSSDVELLIIERETGRVVDRIGGGGDVVYLPRWRDRDSLYIVTDIGEETPYLALYRVGGGIEPIINSEWGVETYGVTSSGEIIYSLNVRGDSRLYIGEKEVEKPMGVVTYIDVDGEATISMNTVKYGESIWRLVGDTLEPILYPREIEDLWDTIVEPEIHTYQSFDGLEIDLLLYRPRNREKPHPTIINPHGGPESQSRPMYSPMIQGLVSLGYAVAQPNYRGGTGYGKTFKEMDRVEKRVDSLRDVYEGARYLIETGLADPERLGIMGGSYGGYVTLYMVTHHPRLFKAAVSVVGIANLETFLRNTGPWRRSHREYKYGSLDRDLDTLRRLSPIHYIDRVETPLLLIHGRNDPRVPVEESIEMYRKLSEKGVETKLIIYEDEGHGVVKRRNREHYMESVAQWFTRHMPP